MLPSGYWMLCIQSLTDLARKLDKSITPATPLQAYWEGNDSLNKQYRITGNGLRTFKRPIKGLSESGNDRVSQTSRLSL